MSKLSAYLPQDRLRALARGETLPDHAQGSALFADISGFTPLTERLTQTLGARRGTEELTRRINAVYDALIGEVERYGGSVIGFAGDAITCWFDQTGVQEAASASQAVACALAMQEAMRAFSDLSLKVAVTTGKARRFVVGDPEIQLVDALAGATISRLATAEHLTQKGEIIVDGVTVAACAGALEIAEWRVDAEAQQYFAVIASTGAKTEPTLLIPELDRVSLETLRPWIPPTVYAREQRGLGEFLTELRPAVAVFLRFTGIDYDGDEPAGQKLDELVKRVQRVAARYDGTLMQLTIGDKGSYVYGCFGAPTAHEDDAKRAVNAALSLRELPRELTFLQPVQIGISRGTMRVGAYGGATRRTYGALGDEVNLAARLMTLAAPDEILVSERAQQLLGEHFALEPRPPVTIKGKTGVLTVFTVTDAMHRRATRLLEPAYRLPMIGRQNELAVIADKLELARQGQGQIIGITAEAGMGKSRLVAEAIRLAHHRGFAGYGGACESSGTNSAYLVWKAIWQAFFDADPTAPAWLQIRQLERGIEDRAPDRLQAMPLLAPIMDVPIADNDFTRTLEPKDRRNALEALLEDCLKAAVKEEPILFVLEDVHWIDPLSHDLLDALARATANLTVCFVLAYRPPELERLQAPRVVGLPHFTKITLNELTPADAEQLIRAKLAQFLPERDDGVPQALVEQLTNKAQGNPFFIEELLNYLRDRDISPYNEQALNALELPSSLHTLILSRMDQLTEPQKATLKVASIIGRLFPFAWLHGYYPMLGTPESVKADLNELSRLDLTPLDTPEPELAYLFKHIVTQEVAYESLEYAARAQLHERLAQYLEARDTGKYLDMLAFHYGRSENVAKQREYLRKAGEAAQAAYANAAALDYFERLIPLLSEPAERIDIHLKRGRVLELVGDWDDAGAAYRSAFGVAGESGDAQALARAQYAIGRLYELRGDFETALHWLKQASAGWQTLGERVELARAQVEIGLVFTRKGGYVPAHEILSDALALARAAPDHVVIALALNALGLVAWGRGDFATARGLFEESLPLRRELGDKRGVARTLLNLGLVALSQGDFAAERGLIEEGLILSREIGDKVTIVKALGNLGYTALVQGDLIRARRLSEEGLTLSREIGDKLDIAITLSNLGFVTLAQGDAQAACSWLKESLTLSQEIGFKLGIMYGLVGLAGVATAQRGGTLRAAQLSGAVEALRMAIGQLLEPIERSVYERTIATAKAALGEDTFNAAFEAGQKMMLDEAVEFALA